MDVKYIYMYMYNVSAVSRRHPTREIMNIFVSVFVYGQMKLWLIPQIVYGMPLLFYDHCLYCYFCICFACCTCELHVWIISFWLFLATSFALKFWNFIILFNSFYNSVWFLLFMWLYTVWFIITCATMWIFLNSFVYWE